MPFDTNDDLLVHRVQIERELGRRSFWDFYQLAWPVMDPEPFVNGKHLRVMTYHLQLAARREIRQIVICVPPRHSKPVHEEAMIRLRGAEVPLREVEVGDWALTHRGRFRQVTAVHLQGELPTMTVRTMSGRSARSAPSHPFLTARGWVEARHLIPGDMLAVARPDLPNMPDQIQRVDLDAPGPCRCLTIEEDQSFVAGGLVVHNSQVCSVAFPAWVWTWWPQAKFITCSYDLRLATRDSAATRRLIESPWYQERWPEVRMLRDQNAKQWYINTEGGMRYVGSPSSGVTGHGSDFNIMDDAHDIKKAETEADRESAATFWFEVMAGRFNDQSRGVSIVAGQRVHTKDIPGECMRRGYHRVVLPARFEHNHPDRCVYDWRKEDGDPLWPGKFDEITLLRLFTTLKPYATASQQQQRPTSREGGLFKRDWFEVVDALPTGIVWVRAWDLAGTEKTMKNDPDWTAGVRIGMHPVTGVIYIANVVRCQEDPGGVQRLIKNTATQDGVDIRIFMPQDPAQAGKMQVLHYVTTVLQGYRLSWAVMSGQGDKLNRADPFAAQCEAGNVKLFKASWNEDFLEELVAFPNGAHDDQVDAASSGYTALLGGELGLLEFMRQQKQEAEEAARPGGPSTR